MCKVVRVVEGECRDCGCRWKIEFFSGEEIFEPSVCPSCWEELEMEVAVISDDDEPLILTPGCKGFER